MPNQFAELHGDRMITDIGPMCPDCHNGDSTLPNRGMWCYLVPSERDWVIADSCRAGFATVQAQCACCHRVECFDVRDRHCDTIQTLRAWHASRADLRHVPGTFYSVTSFLKVGAL